MSKKSRSAVNIILIGAIVGATATVVTAGFGYLKKDRELDVRMIYIG